MIKLIVTSSGMIVPFGFVLSLMDEEICKDIVSDCIAFPNDYYDRYEKAHREKYGTEFIDVIKREVKRL